MELALSMYNYILILPSKIWAKRYTLYTAKYNKYGRYSPFAVSILWKALTHAVPPAWNALLHSLPDSLLLIFQT